MSAYNDWVRSGLAALARLFRRPPGAVPPVEAPPAATPLVLPAAPPPAVKARLQPPPIPAEARRRPAPNRRGMSEQELAWRELMSGRHPGWITRSPSRPASSGSTAA